MSQRPWQQLSNTLLQKTRVFDLYARRLRSPVSTYEDDFFYLSAPDWVNIVPITADGQVVLVRQYRHGIHASSLEVPGGIIESEDPEVAGIRELQEETGYTASKVRSLGTVHPNPAILNNRCHFFVAYDVQKTHRQELDPAEDVRVELLNLDQIPTCIMNGGISHALTVVAFFRLFASNKSFVATDYGPQT